jgi:hypothetical protein
MTSSYDLVKKAIWDFLSGEKMISNFSNHQFKSIGNGSHKNSKERRLRGQTILPCISFLFLE